MPQTYPINYANLEKSIRNNDLSAAVRVNLVTSLALYFFSDTPVFQEYASLNRDEIFKRLPELKSGSYMQLQHLQMLLFRRAVMTFVNNFVCDFLEDHTIDDREVLSMLIHVIVNGWGATADNKQHQDCLVSIRSEMLTLAQKLLESYDPGLASLGQMAFMGLYRAVGYEDPREDLVNTMISGLRYRLGNSEPFEPPTSGTNDDDIPF